MFFLRSEEGEGQNTSLVRSPQFALFQLRISLRRLCILVCVMILSYLNENESKTQKTGVMKKNIGGRVRGRDWVATRPKSGTKKTRPPNVQSGTVWGAVWGTQLEML